ncbi:MAG: hypothetical protein ACRELY_32585, partial [Polyangiaceae bacterium]
MQDSAVQCGDTATVQGGLYNVLCNHSDRWLAQHGKVRGDFWYGEVDYTVSRTCSDVDGDHWCDEHDNCPFAPNTDQADSNDDGIGDACQLCPCDPGNDQDQDGVCGPTCAYGTPGCLQRCAGVNSFASQIDNCPAAKNHMQENCNVLSEQSNDPSEILGDACDPVPCPQSNDDTETNHQNCTGIPGTNFQYLQCEGFSVHDRADLTPIGAHVRNPPTSDPPPAVVVPTTTTARYCQARTADQSPPPINGPTTFSCRAAGVIKDLQLIEETDGSDPNRPWHGITTRTGGFVTIPPDGTFAQNYGNGQTTSLVWQYQHDLAAWLANSADPTIPLPVGNSSCVGSSQEMFPGGATIATTCLNGTFWFHGATHVGQDNDNTFAGGTFVGSHAAQLANNYDDVVVDDNVIGYCPTTSTNFQIVAQAAIRRSEAASPQPIIIWPAGFPGASRAAFEVRSRPDSEFVVSSPLGVNILQDQGSLIPTQNLASAPSTNCGGTTVDNLLASSFAERRWVSGVEPDVRLGRHPEIVSFAIASDATSVVDSAVLDATTLRSSSTSVCPNCDRDFTSELSVSNAPSPRSTFASFYSHALNAVVVAGGKDASNADLHDVWLYDVDSQAWGQLPPPRVPLGAILDATYSFADQNFYVVDRVADNFALDALRVVRFDRLGRHAEVVKSWPILRRVDLGIVLSLDRDGAPLVTVASALGYRMIRLGSDGRRVTAHLVDTGIGTLGFRPVVSRE